jgi:uncharacterized membrane protein YhhN
MMTIIILSCAVAVAALLYAEYRGAERLKWITKPLASASFVTLAVLCGALENSFGQLIVAGLIFCLAGDVLLLSNAARTFLAGMGAFALGHLAYISAFATIWGAFAAPALIAAFAMAALGFVVLRGLWPHLGEFRRPVAIYSLIIGVMVVASFTTRAPNGGLPFWPVAAGAVGFALSDIAVARDRFVRRKFFNRLWGLPLYYGAQLLLASSVAG